MRFIAVCVLTAIAAVGTTLVGASSASANAETIVLCEKAELTCQNPLGNIVILEGGIETRLAEIKALAIFPTLETSVGTVWCETSSTRISLLNDLSKLILGSLLELKFSGNCKIAETSTTCTLTTVALGNLSFTKLAALEASAKSTGGTKVTVQCGAFINCTYGGEPLLKAHSDAEGHTLVLANGAPLTATGGIFCPKVAKWYAAYNVEGKTWIES